jgi:hypothetical protein
MKHFKFVAILMLGVVALWAQSGTTTAPATDQNSNAKPMQCDQKHEHHAGMHKRCPCAHAADAKKECHCKEMMSKKDSAKSGDEAKKDDKPSDHKMMADKDCCGCCGGKCDRMKHKMDKNAKDKEAPKPGM